MVQDVLLQNFGVCTDEVHPDLETALEVARDLGMHQVELLAFWGEPVIALNEAELNRARGLLDRYGMTVSAIGSLFLKLVKLGAVPVGEVVKDAAFQSDLQMLRASIRVAKWFNAPIVRTYSFRRDAMVGLGNPSPRLLDGGEIPDEMLAKIAEGLRIAAREAADSGLILGLENVRSCWANTGVNAARVIGATDHPALRAIWDPGNDYVSGGVPFPDGYAAVRPFIGHVHVKDAVVADPKTGLTRWEAVGRGEVDYVGQFRALRRDGYHGSLCLETHWHPTPPGGGAPDSVADSRTSFEGILAALEASRK